MSRAPCRAVVIGARPKNPAKARVLLKNPAPALCEVVGLPKGKLTRESRESLPACAFADPPRGEKGTKGYKPGRFPVHDKGHAQAALPRLEAAAKAGHVTQGEKLRIQERVQGALQHFNARSENPVAGESQPESTTMAKAKKGKKAAAKKPAAKKAAAKPRKAAKKAAKKTAKRAKKTALKAYKAPKRAAAKKPAKRKASKPRKASKKPAAKPRKVKRLRKSPAKVLREEAVAAAAPVAAPKKPAKRKPSKRSKAAGKKPAATPKKKHHGKTVYVMAPAAPKKKAEKKPGEKKKAKPRKSRKVMDLRTHKVMTFRQAGKLNPVVNMTDVVLAGTTTVVGLGVAEMVDRLVVTRPANKASTAKFGPDALIIRSVTPDWRRLVAVGVPTGLAAAGAAALGYYGQTRWAFTVGGLAFGMGLKFGAMGFQKILNLIQGTEGQVRLIKQPVEQTWINRLLPEVYYAPAAVAESDEFLLGNNLPETTGAAGAHQLGVGCGGGCGCGKRPATVFPPAYIPQVGRTAPSIVRPMMPEATRPGINTSIEPVDPGVVPGRDVVVPQGQVAQPSGSGLRTGGVLIRPNVTARIPQSGAQRGGNVVGLPTAKVPLQNLVSRFGRNPNQGLA